MTTTQPPVQVQASNPAEDRETALKRIREQRVSMANAKRKLEVKDIPGFYLHWILERNIAEAQAAGYQFVKRGEVQLNPLSIADPFGDGNTDPGSNISMVGDRMESGAPVRLYLMKLYQELHDEDQRELDKINAGKLQGIFGEEAIVGAEGQLEAKGPTMYKKALFQRPARKAKITANKP